MTALSNRIAANLAKRKVHYGWAVLAATFLTMLATAGAVGAPGVFIEPLRAEFGWSTAEISSALAIRFLLYGLMGPFAAVLMNRFGVRRTVLAALGIIAVGITASMAMDRLWQLVLSWGVAVGLGTGLTAMVLGATVVTRWFVARRGLAMGLLAASTATGQLLFLPLLASLTSRIGWRSASAMLCIALVLAALAVLALLRDRPSDLGLAPHGANEVDVDDANETAAQPQGLFALLMKPVDVLFAAARVPAFWALFGTFFVCGASTNGLVQTHFIALCGDFGLIATTAASLLALMGVFDFFGTTLSGWLSDRYDNRWLLAWYYGLRGLSLMWLASSDFGVLSLSLFALFYGLDWIATVPPTVKLIAERFGAEQANVVFGWIFAGHQLGAAFAAFGAGWVKTSLGSYLPAFFASGLLCMAAVAMALSMRRKVSV